MLLLLAACERGPKTLAPTVLFDSQAASLRSMNEAGRHAFWGWTWRYEFGVNCTLRVTREYEGKVASVADHPLRGARIAVMPYSTVGFGVKAMVPKRPNADLFDTDTQANANRFAAEAGRLLAGCA